MRAEDKKGLVLGKALEPPEERRVHIRTRWGHEDDSIRVPGMLYIKTVWGPIVEAGEDGEDRGQQSE